MCAAIRQLDRKSDSSTVIVAATLRGARRIPSPARHDPSVMPDGFLCAVDTPKVAG